MTRTLAVCCLTFCVARLACGQERDAASGQIYGELLPFVGLEGVRVQILGIQGVFYNRPTVLGESPPDDPGKAITGLSRTELAQLQRAIIDDIAEAFRRRGVPLLVGRSEQSPDVTPRLEVAISWSRTEPATVGINVTTRLMEAARPIKDPSKIVWAQSWGTDLVGHRASPESLAREIRHVALGGVRQFLNLYARAHAH